MHLNKRTKERECRFYFPRPNTVEAKVIKEMNPKYWIFAGKRNDQLINYFNRTLTTFWLANTDITPCTDIDTVVNYMGKYCNKAEESSESYADIIRQILSKINPTHPKLSLVQKLMNKLMVEHDVSS